MSAAETDARQGRPPGRPRSAEADEAILAAALELLIQDGYRALAMEAVRIRAGVGKATIYRRFKGKQELVTAVLDRLSVGFEAPADTGSLRGDFLALLEVMARTAYLPRMASMMPRLMADTVADEELHAIFYARLVEPRRAVVRELIARAQARGELRTGIEVETAVDAMVGPLVYRVIISGGRPELFGRDPLGPFDLLYAGIAAR